MTQNTTNAPEAQIETIVVDPDDIVDALRFNDKSRGYTGRRRAVIRLHPPFEAEQQASIHYHQSGHYYPPEMHPKPIHLRPEVFLNDDARPLPDRGTVRADARDDLEARGKLDDMTDDEIEAYRDEWVETAFDVWENDVRYDLVDELSESEIVNADGIDVLAGVSVEYVESDE